MCADAGAVGVRATPIARGAVMASSGGSTGERGYVYAMKAWSAQTHGARDKTTGRTAIQYWMTFTMIRKLDTNSSNLTKQMQLMWLLTLVMTQNTFAHHKNLFYTFLTRRRAHLYCWLPNGWLVPQVPPTRPMLLLNNNEPIAKRKGLPTHVFVPRSLPKL